MKTDVVLGLQWGDEGKGKIVDVLARKYPVVARFQGGPNAGHSLHFEGHSFVLRSVPSGIFREDAINIVGNGVVLDPITFRSECENIAKTGVPVKDRILVAKKAHSRESALHILTKSAATDSVSGTSSQTISAKDTPGSRKGMSGHSARWASNVTRMQKRQHSWRPWNTSRSSG